MKQPLILSFVGEQKQNILMWASRHMCDQFEKRGFKTAILNLKNPEESIQRLKELVASYDIRFAFGFAGIGGPVRVGDQSLWDVLRVPFIGLMADHPAYNLALHTVKSSYAARMYRTKDFFDTQQRYLRQPGKSFCMLPQFQMNPVAPQGAWRDRPIDFLYMKNGTNPVALEKEWAHCDKETQSVIWDSIRLCEGRTDVLIADVLAQRCGLPPERINENSVQFWTIVQLIDEYLRSLRQNWMVDFLKNFPAIIIGQGWDHIDRSGSKATFLPAVDASDVMQIYTQTKILFNTNPYFDHSVHERVLFGLSSKAYVVTDGNAFTRDYLHEADGLISFDLNDENNAAFLADTMARSLAKGEPAYDATAVCARMGGDEDYGQILLDKADEIRAAAQRTP